MHQRGGRRGRLLHVLCWRAGDETRGLIGLGGVKGEIKTFRSPVCFPSKSLPFWDYIIIIFSLVFPPPNPYIYFFSLPSFTAPITLHQHDYPPVPFDSWCFSWTRRLCFFSARTVTINPQKIRLFLNNCNFRGRRQLILKRVPGCP